ncbi:MAG: hypothetical protein JWP36_2817 [Paucimonas sp.]|nr:hypothetical protein [Paucimonas sp.]
MAIAAPIPDCQLLLALPAALEQDALDALLAEPGLVIELNLLAAEAPGLFAPLTSTMEKVRGRARRTLLVLLTRDEHVPALLAALERALGGADVSWWRLPLSGAGNLRGSRH